MKKNKLNFGNFDTESDFDKEIEGEVEEIKKEADLYFNYLYFPVINSKDISLGIFPEDQQITRKHIILWNSIKTIPMSFKSPDYKILKVEITPKEIQERLKNHGAGIYSLPFIPNTVPVAETDNRSFYSE